MFRVIVPLIKPWGGNGHACGARKDFNHIFKHAQNLVFMVRDYQVNVNFAKDILSQNYL